MTALAADTTRDSRNLGPIRQYPCGVDIFYVGALVMLDSSGHAMPAQASVTNKGCVGVAIEQVDNSAGSAGDLYVLVQEGEYKFTGQTMAQSSVGSVIYADDDDTVDETQATNCPKAGIMSEFVSATAAWVEVSLSNSKH